MRNTLWTTSLLVLALWTAGASGQGMPRDRTGRRSGDDRSPSMSRTRTPLQSNRNRNQKPTNRFALRPGTRSVPAGKKPTNRFALRPGTRSVPAGKKPSNRVDVRPGTRSVPPGKKPSNRVDIRPGTRSVPPGKKPSNRFDLRPGVGSVPSGQKHPYRFDRDGFIQLPGSRGRTPARSHSPRTRRPSTPRTFQPPRPPAHRKPLPSVYKPPRRIHKPRVYRPSWNRRIPFTPGWYKTRVRSVPPRRSARYHPWTFDRPGHRSNHWWVRATATVLNTWLRHRWTRHVYYVYGTGGNVFYHSSVVYVNGARYSTAYDYYQQARAIALAVPDLDEAAAARLEWMPLGVFAITRKGVTETNTYLQLAVTREGIIAGTYYNEATGISRPIEGMVDNNTQRAAWMFADGKNTEFVIETSFYNLTQDNVPVLVHFGPDRVQDGLLIRMESPAEE